MEDRLLDDEGSREELLPDLVDVSRLGTFVQDDEKILGDPNYLRDLTKRQVESRIRTIDGLDKRLFTPMALARIKQIRSMLEGAMK